MMWHHQTSLVSEFWCAIDRAWLLVIGDDDDDGDGDGDGDDTMW